MFEDLFDELHRYFPRFRIADIKAMANALFQHSFFDKAPQLGGLLRDSPTKVSLIESFAHSEGRTYISISVQ